MPLVAIFTKFDAQVTKEYVELKGIDSDKDKWEKAREKAEETFENVYLPKVLNAECPPKASMKLEGEYDKHIFLHSKKQRSNKFPGRYASARAGLP